MRNDWKSRMLNDKLQVDSAAQDEVLRTSNINEPAESSTSTNKPRKPANYNRSPQSIAGQKKVSSSHDPEPEEEKR